PRLKEVFAVLWANVTFRHLLLCMSVMYFFSYGIYQWQPAFFVRSYGLTSGELGTWFAMINGVGGLLGTYWGGEWAARHAVHNEPVQLRTAAVMFVVLGLGGTLTYLAPNYYVAFAISGTVLLAG